MARAVGTTAEPPRCWRRAVAGTAEARKTGGRENEMSVPSNVADLPRFPTQTPIWTGRRRPMRHPCSAVVAYRHRAAGGQWVRTPVRRDEEPVTERPV